MKSMLHLGSILLLLVTWIIGSDVIGARLLPEPSAVALALVDEARSGALTFNLGATLLRVLAAFAMAMVLGTVIGLLMGRNAIFDWLADPWLVVLLNLPALLVVLVLMVLVMLGFGPHTGQFGSRRSLSSWNFRFRAS